MLGESEPHRRCGHVAVHVKHNMLIFGGAWWNDRQYLEPLSENVIWMYNLYTEQWTKYIIPTKERDPQATHVYGAHAEVIESVIYMFGGRNI